MNFVLSLSLLTPSKVSEYWQIETWVMAAALYDYTMIFGPGERLNSLFKVCQLIQYVPC